MCFAPFGVGAAIAFTVGQNGLGVLVNLGKLVLTLYGALLAFIVLVLVPVMLIARIPVVRFFKTVREPALLAFSTATSEAALPDAFRLMERFGVPRRIVSFVLPADTPSISTARHSTCRWPQSLSHKPPAFI